MKINRLELIAKIQGMVAEREAAAQARKAQAYEEIGEAETNYVRDNSEAWSAFATRIRNRVRQGTVITIDDVPERLRSSRTGWRATVNLFTPTTVRDSDYLPRTDSLTRLLAVLESCPDEFVTDSSLARIGAPIRELMRP